MLDTELLQLERTTIFFGKHSSVQLFSMLIEAGTCNFGENQKLFIYLVIHELSHVDQKES